MKIDLKKYWKEIIIFVVHGSFSFILAAMFFSVFKSLIDIIEILGGFSSDDFTLKVFFFGGFGVIILGCMLGFCFNWCFKYIEMSIDDFNNLQEILKK